MGLRQTEAKMIYQTFTTYAVSLFTNRHCIRFTEMAYVIVAVFESGRPQFISKKKLHQFVVRRECRNDGKLQAEWKIGVLAGVSKQDDSIPVEVFVKRLRRAGLVGVGIVGSAVYGSLPSDEMDD